jgi:hypothetical protein
MPIQFKSLAFWKAVSFAIAGILAVLISFNVVPAQYGYPAEGILALVLSALQFFGVTPELRARGLK